MSTELIENKFNKYIASPEGFWNDCLENRRKLTYDEQQQYQNLCEVYSDIYSYFMCKKAFTIMEVKGLLRQYKYFNMVAKEANKLITFLSNIPERGLTQEEKELLRIKYEFFKKLVAHEFKWGFTEDQHEALRLTILVDDLYFGLR